MIMNATRPSVLVIDDEIGPRESLRILLKKEFEVHCAESVERGLQLLKEHRPDVVVMDIRMPNMNGIEGLRAIREEDAGVAVIMLTGFGALETAQEAIRLGANDYLRKPFDAREMTSVIKENVKRTQVNRQRARMEENLREINRQLITELADKRHLASLGQASAELVHDLRNPLTVMQGYLQLLWTDVQEAGKKADGGLEGARECFEAIEHSLERCRAMVDAWQRLSRKTPIGLEPVDIAGLVRLAAEEAEALAARKNARVEGQFCATGCLIRGDSVQIGRALQNVLVNAVEALPESGGRVRVTFDVSDEAAQVVVEDNGCGIPREQLARIWSPDFTTKAHAKGTGLGLFITRKIVEAHGGRIEAASEVGRGTRMVLRFPFQPAVTAEVAGALIGSEAARAG